MFVMGHVRDIMYRKCILRLCEYAFIIYYNRYLLVRDRLSSTFKRVKKARQVNSYLNQYTRYDAYASGSKKITHKNIL